MNMNSELLSPAEECAGHRLNIAGLIRQNGGLTEEQRVQLEQHGVRYDPATGLVSWSPLPGEPNDPVTERDHLLFGVFLLLGPPEPITEEELAEAMASGMTLEDLLAEFDATIPKGDEGSGR